MDSFEFNKIAGAVLAALLVAFGGGTLAAIFQGEGAVHNAKPGYKLPVTGDEASTPGAGKPAGYTFEAVAALFPDASADNGSGVFRRCKACHTPDKGGKAGTGPNLWGIVGRDIASDEAFTRYSTALKQQEGGWTLEKLALYLYNPRKAIPGNKMAFAGLKSNDDLADVLAYLNSLSDSPQPLSK